ncbi:hypothetical protein PQR62_16755 [Herbaspirillum lusitanum]|jgi:hypothetical protein|uniref:Uncharacterized protein n=1 Tax=Herbaspirillum lusitanum TaxID=213312 RepID=A0ABW9ABU9_9BURK
MEIATIATGVATAWLAKKAVETVGGEVGKAAGHVIDEVVGFVTPSLPANLNIGRIINTWA